MKKIRLPVILLLFVFLTACSSQEKMNPAIFIERVTRSNPDISFDVTNSYFDNETFICFFSYKNLNNIVLKININDNQTVKKISLSSNESNEIFDVIYTVISVYSPNENADIIIGELKNNNEIFRYSYGKEYIYSLAVKDNIFYFEVFNKRLNDYTVPELTLKPNDKTEF